MVLGTGLLQGVVQALGVTSIAPFLMLASDPDRFLHSAWGAKLVSVFPQLNGATLVVAAGLFSILMLFLANAVSLWADVTRTRYAHQFGHWLRMRLLRHILGQPYSYFFRRNTSVLTKKVVGDVGDFTTNLVLPLFDMLARLATAISLTAVLFAFQPLAALLAVAGLGSYYTVVFRLLRSRRSALSGRMKSARRGEFFALGQLFGALKMIFARDCADAFVGRFSRFSRQQAKAGTMVPLCGSVPRYILEPVAYGSLILWILLSMAAGNSLTAILPTIGVIAMAGYRLLPNLQQLFARLVMLTTSRHCLEEILTELCGDQPQVAETVRWPSEAVGLDSSFAPASEVRRTKAQNAARLGKASSERLTGHGPIQRVATGQLSWDTSLELTDVTYTYPASNQPALKNVSLRILKGSSVGFVGPTGSGKSTLADVILGLLTPDSGQILLDGKPLSAADLPLWRAGIGYVPQDVFLLDATVEENIAFGVDKDEIDTHRVRESARLAQLLDFIEAELPNGFKTRVGEHGVCLSGGQRQRIGLARALYFQPQLLILDEATSALDNDTEARLMDSLQSLPHELTTLTIAHRISTVRNCKMLCYVQDGIIQGQGDHNQLEATCQEFRHLVTCGNVLRGVA